MDCIFCGIIEKKSEAEILFEDEDLISILDIRPLNYGHSLVIPKAHYENFISVPDEAHKKLITGVKRISQALVESLQPDGFNIIVNSGTAAGQTVFHFHYHIIPRFADDGFRPKLNLKNYREGVMREFADKIRESVINLKGPNGK